MTTEFLTTKAGHKLAYNRTVGDGPMLVWFGGFNSDKEGSKALHVEEWCKAHGHGYVRFDYFGHGMSEGDFASGTISTWREDGLAIIDEICSGDVILLGSSMGGWLSLLAAQARPESVKGLLLIAPAHDFTERLMWETFPKEVQKEIMNKRVWMRPSDYGEPYPITRNLIEDGRKWLLGENRIEFAGPVRILQGYKDEDVPYLHAWQLVEQVASKDLTFQLVKSGDHRLSEEDDLRRLTHTLEEMTGCLALTSR